MFNQVLEYRCLAGLFQFPEYITKINTRLFTDDRVGVYDAMQRAYTTYGTISNDSVRYFYGEDLPAQLDVVVNVDLDPVVDELVKLAKKRKLAEIANKAADLSLTPNPEFESLMIALQDDVYQEIDSTTISGVAQFIDMQEQKNNESYVALTTGFTWLDAMLGGEWNRGEVSLITGLTGGGKTALWANTILRMALKRIPILVFSLEMTKADLITRWVSDLTGINSLDLRAGRVVKEKRGFNLLETSLINEALKTIQGLPIHLIDEPELTASEIIALSRKHLQYGIQAIFIDYVQLISVVGLESKHYGLGEATKQIKNFCKQKGLAAILLAQLNEDGNIRDSGDVAKHAACIINITLGEQDPTGVRDATLTFKKNRHGRVGQYPLLFNGNFVRFENVNA